jgi:hypothetical protein
MAGGVTLSSNLSTEKKRKRKTLKWGWVCSSVVEHLPNMCKALSSIPSTRRKKKAIDFQKGEELSGIPQTSVALRCH